MNIGQKHFYQNGGREVVFLSNNFIRGGGEHISLQASFLFLPYGKFANSTIKAADRPFDIHKKMKITNKTLFLLTDMFQLLYQHNTNCQCLLTAKGQGRDEVLCDDELLCNDE